MRHCTPRLNCRQPELLAALPSSCVPSSLSCHVRSLLPPVLSAPLPPPLSPTLSFPIASLLLVAVLRGDGAVDGHALVSRKWWV